MENEITNSEKSLEQLLAEAEERGYRRGVEERLARPGVWESADSQAENQDDNQADDSFCILQGARRSIWD